jgi:hypothetical protein
MPGVAGVAVLVCRDPRVHDERRAGPARRHEECGARARAAAGLKFRGSHRAPLCGPIARGGESLNVWERAQVASQSLSEQKAISFYTFKQAREGRRFFCGIPRQATADGCRKWGQ